MDIMIPVGSTTDPRIFMESAFAMRSIAAPIPPLAHWRQAKRQIWFKCL